MTNCLVIEMETELKVHLLINIFSYGSLNCRMAFPALCILFSTSKQDS